MTTKHDSITGKMYLRKKDIEINGKKVFMLFGVLGADEETYNQLPNEAFIVVSGDSDNLILLHDAETEQYEEDQPELLQPNAFFVRSFWRV